MALPRGSKVSLVVVVLALVVTVAALSFGPIVVQGPPGPTNYSEYELSKLAVQPIESEGQPSPEVTDKQGLVVIDSSHRNHFQKREIQSLASAISATGYQVEFLDSGDDFSAALSRADGFVVIAPGVPFTAAEADRVERFVDNGGRLLMFGEPTQISIERAGLFLIAVSQENQLDSLAGRFGMDVGERHLYNMEHNDGNFLDIIATGSDGSLADGVDRTALSTAAAVEVRDGTRVLDAAPATRSDRADATGDYALAVRSGNVVAVGDSTFLTQEKFSIGDNDVFIANLAEFLVTGDRQRTLLDYPAIVDRQPTVTYTSTDLLTAAKTVSEGLAADRPGRPRVVLAPDRVRTNATDVLITTFGWLRTHPVNTGLTVRAGEVSVGPFQSNTTAVYVIHAPDGGLDVVIAADTAAEAERAAETLADGTFEQDAVTNSTAVGVTETD